MAFRSDLFIFICFHVRVLLFLEGYRNRHTQIYYVFEMTLNLEFQHIIVPNHSYFKTGFLNKMHHLVPSHGGHCLLCPILMSNDRLLLAPQSSAVLFSSVSYWLCTCLLLDYFQGSRVKSLRVKSQFLGLLFLEFFLFWSHYIVKWIYLDDWLFNKQSLSMGIPHKYLTKSLVMQNDM